MTSPKRVLIIESNYEEYYFFRNVLHEIASDIILMHESYSLTAIKYLSDKRMRLYDIIFLNWNMPEVTGRECLISIRLLSHYSKVPIIVYSTSNDLPNYEEVIHLGAAYLFTKPVNSAELHTKLQNIFVLCKYLHHSEVDTGNSTHE